MSCNWCHGHLKPIMADAKPWEETDQGRIHTRSPPFLLMPRCHRCIISPGWLIWHPFPKSVCLYFHLWSCPLPFCYLAGTIAPMSKSSKHIRSHQTAEKTGEAFLSTISIIQMRRQRDRCQKSHASSLRLPLPQPLSVRGCVVKEVRRARWTWVLPSCVKWSVSVLFPYGNIPIAGILLFWYTISYNANKCQIVKPRSFVKECLGMSLCFPIGIESNFDPRLSIFKRPSDEIVNTSSTDVNI